MNDVNISNNEKITELPKEEYIFKFCEEELDNIRKAYTKKGNQILSFFFVTWGLLLAYYMYLDFNSIMVGVIFCLLIFIMIRKIRNNKKWRIDRVGVSQCTYEYKLFDKYMYIYIYRDAEEVARSKIYYKDITRVSMVDGYIVFEFNQGAYFARCSDLNKDSHLYACLRKFQNNRKAPKIKKKK